MYVNTGPRVKPEMTNGFRIKQSVRECRQPAVRSPHLTATLLILLKLRCQPRRVDSGYSYSRTDCQVRNDRVDNNLLHPFHLLRNLLTAHTPASPSQPNLRKRSSQKRLPHLPTLCHLPSFSHFRLKSDLL